MHNSIPDDWFEQRVDSKTKVYWHDDGDVLVQSENIFYHVRHGQLVESQFHLTGQQAFEASREWLWRYSTRNDG